MEHDTPLLPDLIDWEKAIEVVCDRHLDLLRFHHESLILGDHEHLMIDNVTKNMLGLPIRRTRQWSQRPHLANVEYYHKIMFDNFSMASRTMIEDKMHSVVQRRPPAQHRLAIYHPDGDIRRSGHLDGRGEADKYPMKYS